MKIVALIVVFIIALVLALTVWGAHWAWLHFSMAGLKHALSFVAFWSFIAALVRAVWHLGSWFKAKGRV